MQGQKPGQKKFKHMFVLEWGQEKYDSEPACEQLRHV